jgi:acyl-CoA synthetase (AMP-forming)/AMP-acid ligase II
MLQERVLRMASKVGERPALIDAPTGLTVTYELLAERIEQLAAGLRARRIGPGFVAAIWARNMPQWAGFALGALRAGGTVTGVSPVATERELAGQLADACADVIITVPARVDAALAAATSAGVREVVVIGEAPNAVSAADLIAAGADAEAAAGEVERGDLALLPYSSGTTGLPKGVMLTHANLTASLEQLQAALRVGPDDTTIAVAPFAHIMGFMLSLALPLAGGATVVTDGRFDFVRFLSLVEQHRATYLVVPPPVMAGLARHPLVDRHDLSSLNFVVSGGAPLSARLQREVAERLPGAVVGQGYGMTETTAGIAVPDRERGTVPGSVGRAPAGTELRILADGATSAPDGSAEGELLVRGPQVMAGYLGRPDATAAAFHDGWLRTGDLVRLDHDGNLFVIDRLKELIKVNANQVAPAELEALLLTHPSIADAAVVGRPDQKCGEVPVAFVVARDELAEDELIDWVAERVAPYKLIAAAHAVDELPRTPAGKLLRRQLPDCDYSVAT